MGGQGKGEALQEAAGDWWAEVEVETAEIEMEESGAVTGLEASMGLAAAEAAIGGSELLELLVIELGQSEGRQRSAGRGSRRGHGRGSRGWLCGGWRDGCHRRRKGERAGGQRGIGCS